TGAGTTGTFTKTGQDVTGTFRVPTGPEAAAEGVMPVAFIPTTTNANPGEQINCSPVNAGVITCAGHTAGDPAPGGVFRMLYTRVDGTRGVVYATVNADVNATPVPCPPGQTASQPTMTVNPKAPDAVQAMLAAGTGSGIPNNVLRAIHVDSTSNAVVDYPNQGSGISGAFSITLLAGTTQTSFDIHQIDPSQGATVSFALEDACGTWHLFAGAGPEIFRQAAALPAAPHEGGSGAATTAPAASVPAPSPPAAGVPAPSAPAASATAAPPGTRPASPP